MQTRHDRADRSAEMQFPSGEGKDASWRRRTVLTFIGLTIAFLPLYANRIVAVAGVDAEFFGGPPSVLLWNWLAVGLLTVFILRFERYSLASVGLLRPKPGDLNWALWFFAIATVVPRSSHLCSRRLRRKASTYCSPCLCRCLWR